MVVLSRCLPLLVAMVPLALASSNLEVDLDQPELIQRVMNVDFERVRETFRAMPSKGKVGDIPDGMTGHDVPVCPPGRCADNCIHDEACFKRPMHRDSYSQLCGIVGCSARKGSPVCPVGQCDGGCICREELWSKLNILLINDALGELSSKAGETRGKDEL